MPRRPTRSRSNKPTRKELNRRLDDIEGADSENQTLAEVIAQHQETTDGDDNDGDDPDSTLADVINDNEHS
jgi:hypothetical protein